MTLILLLLAAGVWVLFALRRRAKRRLVAGLVPERPGFFIEPPAGRVGRMKDGAL